MYIIKAHTCTVHVHAYHVTVQQLWYVISAESHIILYTVLCVCGCAGDEWYDGEGGLGAGSQDPHWNAAHWLRQCSVCLHTL